MSEMIERMAQALWAARDKPEPYATHADVLRREARAVVAAMREPTAAMIQAGGNAVYAEGGPATAASDDQAAAAWRAMIDAAL